MGYAPPDLKRSARPADASARDQLLAYAADRPRVESRAIRATLSIHQLHLTEFHDDD
jgi:hypothetical protein